MRFLSSVWTLIAGIVTVFVRAVRPDGTILIGNNTPTMTSPVKNKVNVDTFFISSFMV